VSEHNWESDPVRIRNVVRKQHERELREEGRQAERAAVLRYLRELAHDNSLTAEARLHYQRAVNAITKEEHL
jgi:hypothetical protein